MSNLVEIGKTYIKTARGATALVIGSAAILPTIYLLQDNVTLALLTALGQYYLSKKGFEIMREARHDREAIAIEADLEKRLEFLRAQATRIINVPPEDYSIM